MRLAIRNLTKVIDKTIVLDRISYSFEAGIIYGLTGSRNSGKTLLFRCISGEEVFDKGSIRINRNEKDERIGFLNVGCVLSSAVVPELLTGKEFVAHFLSLHNMETDDNAIKEYLKIVGIDKNMASRQIYHYTEEMKGHLQLLCMYILKPDIVLVEEPMEEYSETTAKLLKRLLNELKDNSVVIMSTGNTKLLDTVCDEVIAIRDGRLESVGIAELDLEG